VADPQGKAIIFSAPSGSGKTTLVHHLLANNPNLSFSVSATTRPPRPGEVHAQDYYFLSLTAFKELIQQNAFVEWEEVYPNRYYGTLKSEIDRIWSKGHNVIFDIDVQGGLALKRYFGPQALAVFVQAPSLEVLKKRLLARASDPSDSINQRLEKASYELSFANRFDLIIRNDDLETSKTLAQQAYTDFR
jgi:guanylate kinase